ncbi:MAG: hypothetical protein WC683_20505 [bacterium]
MMTHLNADQFLSVVNGVIWHRRSQWLDRGEPDTSRFDIPFSARCEIVEEALEQPDMRAAIKYLERVFTGIEK